MADNSLGLQLGPDEGTPVPAPEEPKQPETEQQAEAPAQDQPEGRPKNKPYINPDRVKTGGAQRDKLREDALTERMQKMREQNEKIKQRRLAVEADEESWRKVQAEERAKQARARKMQEDINRTREKVALRKMEKAHNRAWDSEKPASKRAENSGNSSGSWADSDPNEAAPDPPEEASAPPDDNERGGEGQWSRGGGPYMRGSRGRGERRGRARGRGRGE